MKITYYILTGSNKHECEDSAFFNGVLEENRIVEYSDSVLYCIGVADGVGGNAGGRIASRYVAHQISQLDFSSMAQKDIFAVAADINTNLISHAMSIPGKADMATTLTCVVAAKDGYYLIHAGNTRLYIMQGSYLKQLTVDHTTHNWLIECGQYEAAELCRKSEINCCFGGGNQHYANHLVIEKVFDDYLPDTLIFTSDGIHDFVNLDFMENAFSSNISDFDTAQTIIEEAHKNGSIDDTTIIILRR